MATQAWKFGIGMTLGICVGCGDLDIPPDFLGTDGQSGHVGLPTDLPPSPPTARTACTPICSDGYCDSDCDGWFDDVELASGFDPCDWRSPNYHPEWLIVADVCDLSGTSATARARQSESFGRPAAEEMLQRHARQLEALAP